MGGFLIFISKDMMTSFEVTTAMNNLARTDYEIRLQKLIPITETALQRSSCLYGIQPPYHRDFNPNPQAFSKNKIRSQAVELLKGGKLPNPKVVMLEGIPIVIDGHHTIRAYGLAYRKSRNPIFNEITVDIYSLADYLKAMETSLEDFISLVNATTWLYKLVIDGERAKRNHNFNPPYPSQIFNRDRREIVPIYAES